MVEALSRSWIFVPFGGIRAITSDGDEDAPLIDQFGDFGFEYINGPAARPGGAASIDPATAPVDDRTHRQVVVTGPGSAAPAEPASPQVFELPSDAAHFVGRDRHRGMLDEIVASASDGGPPLVTISGPPGAGKLLSGWAAAPA